MPPAPKDPQENSPQTPAPTPGSPAQVDIDKILLPKKEVPGTTVDSAQRVSAGVLLEQEIKAGTEGLPKQPAEEKPPAAPPPAAKVSEVKPLVTYQSAIEEAMRGGDVSVVSIAAAEAKRRAQKGVAEPVVETEPVDYAAIAKKYAMILGGIVLIAAAASAIGYLALRPTTVPIATDPSSPFISVDQTSAVLATPGMAARDLVQKLDEEKKKVSLSLGLIARHVPAFASSTIDGTVQVPMSGQQFMSAIAPNIPDSLLRTIEPVFLLGTHVYDGNQPFLILRVDAYQEAFSGMLAWEIYLKNNLAPLFTYTPTERLPEQKIEVSQGPIISTSTASSTATSSATSTPQPGAPTLAVTFADKIVENHDARVLQNQYGDIFLLWTFIDRNTLVITTNAATLREILSRLKNAPVTNIPGQ